MVDVSTHAIRALKLTGARQSQVFSINKNISEADITVNK